MTKKTRRAKPLQAEQVDYVRGPPKPLALEPDAALNDIGADLMRLRSLIRVIEDGLEQMPCDVLAGNVTSGDIAELATIARRFAGEIIADIEKLSASP